MLIDAVAKDSPYAFDNDVGHPREARTCCGASHPCGGAASDDVVLFDNAAVGIAVLIIGIVLLLILLGIVKGLLGMYCCPPVGMCGLGALIDLPRPLDQYQEDELQDFPVKYDMIGWPIHPQTNKRTVRAISLKCEFGLNVVFFLTYPLIMIVTLLTTCCFSQVYDNEDVHDTIYKKDHTIMLTECPSVICHRNTNRADAKCIVPAEVPTPRVYNDESATEDYDTRYVLQQMHKSEQSLRFS